MVFLYQTNIYLHLVNIYLELLFKQIFIEIFFSVQTFRKRHNDYVYYFLDTIGEINVSNAAVLLAQGLILFRKRARSFSDTFWFTTLSLHAPSLKGSSQLWLLSPLRRINHPVLLERIPTLAHLSTDSSSCSLDTSRSPRVTMENRRVSKVVLNKGTLTRPLWKKHGLSALPIFSSGVDRKRSLNEK